MKNNDPDPLASRIKIEDVKTINDDCNTSEIVNICIVEIKKILEARLDRTQQFDSGPCTVSPRKASNLVVLPVSESAHCAVKHEDSPVLRKFSESNITLETNKNALDEKLQSNLTPSQTNNATKDTSKHICHICGKVFFRNDNVKRHMLSHRGEKKFKCPTCGKNFARADNLVRHIRRLHNA